MASVMDSLSTIGVSLLAGASERAIQWSKIAESPPKPKPVDPQEALYDATYGSPGDASLYMDDIGWIPEYVGSNGLNGELSPYDRIATVRRARLYYVKESMAKQSVRLHTVYCVGRGMSIKARDYQDTTTDTTLGANTDPNDIGGDNPDSLRVVGNDDFDEGVSSETALLQQHANEFWEHPDNASAFGTEAQSINSDRLNVDGELFYVLIPRIGNTYDDTGNLIPDDDNVTRVRVIKDCLQIGRIYYNPDDDSEPWWYLRTSRQGGLYGKTVHRLYPDHRLFFKREAGPDGTTQVRLPPKPDDPAINDDVQIMKDQYIFHMRVNTISERGNSLLTPIMDWAKVNRRYLEDRATISSAHARIAWKRVIKGPANAVAAFGKKAMSAIGVGSNSPSTGIPLPTMAGQTLNVNQGVDWQAQNAQDGGKNAYIESRNFRLMIYAGAGFAEHYYGDGSNGTRATSKSMERPTELQLQAYQTVIKSGYEVMFAFHLAAIGHDYDAHSVWVDAPQILEDDTATIVTSLLSVIGVLPEFDIDEILIRMLNAFGIDDPQDVLVKIRKRQKQLYNEYLELVFAQNGLDPESLAGLDMTDPESLKKIVGQQQKLIGMLTPAGDATQMPGPKKPPQFAQGGLGAKLRVRKPSPPGMRPTAPVAAA